MKKLLATVFTVVALTSFAAAQQNSVVVNKFADFKSILGNSDTGRDVTYKSLTVEAPKGSEVTAKETGNTIILSSPKFTGVKVNGKTINSKKGASVSFNTSTYMLSVIKGQVTITDADGTTRAFGKASKGEQQTEAAPLFTPITEDLAAQQAVLNAYENLSPSTPR